MFGNKYAGFTLIDLMVAVVILAILLSLAVPGYTQFIKQSRRDDAKHLLLLNAQRLQRCFTLEGVYNGSCSTRTNSKGGYYTLSSDSQISSTSFTLVAEPVSDTSQASDGACTTFHYDHTGKRSATGSDDAVCW